MESASVDSISCSLSFFKTMTIYSRQKIITLTL